MKLDLEICRISVFIIGETVIQIGNQSIFLVMILLEPVHSSLIGIYIWGEKHACCWKIGNAYFLKLINQKDLGKKTCDEGATKNIEQNKEVVKD